MKLNRFIPAFVCLLVVVGTVGCGLRPGAPNSPTQSSAGLVEKLTIDELAARADSILIGEITDIAYYQEANIYTLVTLSVEQTIKGESEGEEVIKLPGGEVGGLGGMKLYSDPEIQKALGGASY